MEVLFQKYGKSGQLEILPFPCNNFGSQEPGTNAEIESFARNKMGYQGPLYGKLDCDNGASTHPLFQALMGGIDNGIYGQGLKWNFAKFLCGADGVAVQRYSPRTSPLAIEEDIAKIISGGLAGGVVDAAAQSDPAAEVTCSLENGAKSASANTGIVYNVAAKSSTGSSTAAPKKKPC
jgi:glutathione peroxidase-family protein